MPNRKVARYLCQLCKLMSYIITLSSPMDNSPSRKPITRFSGLLNNKLECWSSPLLDAIMAATVLQSVSTTTLCWHHLAASSRPSLQAIATTSSAVPLDWRKLHAERTTLPLSSRTAAPMAPSLEFSSNAPSTLIFSQPSCGAHHLLFFFASGRGFPAARGSQTLATYREDHHVSLVVGYCTVPTSNSAGT